MGMPSAPLTSACCKNPTIFSLAIHLHLKAIFYLLVMRSALLLQLPSSLSSHLLASSKLLQYFFACREHEFNLILFFLWKMVMVSSNCSYNGESLGPISDVSYFVDHPLGHISSASKLSVSSPLCLARQSHGESQKCCMGTYFYQTTEKRYCIHSYAVM